MYENERKSFGRLNRIAVKNSVVLFGSTFAKNMPVCELKQSFGLSCDIYNRSIDNLSVFDAASLLEECVMELLPKKLLIQLGEQDIQQGCGVRDIVSAYEKILKTLKAADKHCDIVIVSVCGESDSIKELNRQLEETAKRSKCRYADITAAFANETPVIKAFGILRYYIRDTISCYDALTMVSV